MNSQKTIKKKIVIDGLGLHTGIITKLALLPADVNTGIIFIRTDLKKSEPVEAIWKNIIPAKLCTKISNKKGDNISTIEHLMFALYSLEITNLIIEINGPEVPILDGSAKIFIEEISNCGLVIQEAKVKEILIKKSFEICVDDKFIKYHPTKNNFLEIDYTIHYKDQFVKKQNFSLNNVIKNYKDVYNCRTFCHQEDLEKIFAMGLAKGGSLENAIVISGNKILNQEGLRFDDEFVRHKILDCIGDLYLSGFFITGKITCYQGGHELTSVLIKKIFQSKNNYHIKKEKDEMQKVKNKSILISRSELVV